MRILVTMLGTILLLISCDDGNFKAGSPAKFSKGTSGAVGADASVSDSNTEGAQTDPSNPNGDTTSTNGSAVDRDTTSTNGSTVDRASTKSVAPNCQRVKKRWVGPEKINLNENTPGTAPNSLKSHATCRDNAPEKVIFDSVNCLQSPWSCKMTSSNGGCNEPGRPCFTCQCMECSGDVIECK